ncbi:hypothetical protein [Paenibacillus tarimensis]|uniref:hypothetical protein n=1 Tax=Paenibacillus tarimensis TaxID=416012 RepID=UPI001F252F7F|nr:hypothetical protein [Paenibacillus tarimensis]MCF2942156.1 hypothetical protein [Paenibacillus tarimensis]
MSKIDIVPFEGIGPVKLRMSKKDAEYTLTKNISGRSLNSIFTRIEYDGDDKIAFIEVTNPYHKDIVFLYKGLDVFNLKAEEVIKEISKENDYVRDAEAESGHSFLFKETQLSFWRSHILTEGDLKSDWFKELNLEDQEIEKRNLYFITVAIAIPGLLG